VRLGLVRYNALWEIESHGRVSVFLRCMMGGQRIEDRLERLGRKARWAVVRELLDARATPAALPVMPPWRLPNRSQLTAVLQKKQELCAVALARLKQP
jgi:hypothetical protein